MVMPCPCDGGLVVGLGSPLRVRFWPAIVVKSGSVRGNGEVVMFARLGGECGELLFLSIKLQVVAPHHFCMTLSVLTLSLLIPFPG